MNDLLEKIVKEFKANPNLYFMSFMVGSTVTLYIYFSIY